MIWSRGWGILALLTPILVNLIIIALYGKTGNSSLEQFLYSLLSSGVLLIGVSFFLDKNKKHDLYYISIRLWGGIWIAVSVIALLYQYLK